MGKFACGHRVPTRQQRSQTKSPPRAPAPRAPARPPPPRTPRAPFPSSAPSCGLEGPDGRPPGLPRNPPDNLTPAGHPRAQGLIPSRVTQETCTHTPHPTPTPPAHRGSRSLGRFQGPLLPAGCAPSTRARHPSPPLPQEQRGGPDTSAAHGPATPPGGRLGKVRSQGGGERGTEPRREEGVSPRGPVTRLLPSAPRWRRWLNPNSDPDRSLSHF